MHRKGCHPTGEEVLAFESENLSRVCLCSVLLHHPERESLNLQSVGNDRTHFPEPL